MSSPRYPESSPRYPNPPFLNVPKAQIGRRVAASGIDFVLAWLSSYVAATGQVGPSPVNGYYS